jgi:hypothetical protein
MPDFKRLNATRLYLAQSVSQLDARLGYLLPESAEPVPDFISLPASLTQYQGAYLFFPKLPQTSADLDTFLGNAYAFLKSPGRGGTRFAWFPSTTGTLDGEILRVDNGPVTADRIDFIFQNFSLRLVKGNRISASTDNLALEFQPSAGEDNFLIVTPQGVQPPVSFTAAVPVRLPLFADENSGCFTFAIESNQDGTNTLDIGLRYFMPSPDDPDYANSLRYPIFDLAPPTTMNFGAKADATELALAAAFDPLDQLNPKRTYFTVSVPASAAANGAAAIRSYFMNPLGEPMRLVPGTASRLVFNTLAQFASGDQNIAQPYYLAPSGDYGITNAASANADAPPGQFNSNVVCGLSSVEYVALDTQAPTDISFVDNSDAWAPATYNLDPITGETKIQFGNLTGAARTSWVWFRSTGGNPGYFAQPDSSVLYVPPQTAPALDAPGFLSYGAIKAGELLPEARRDAVGGEGKSAFPMVAYRGIQGDSINLFQQLELQVLNPQRRQLIPDAPPTITAARGAAANPESGTTPQGLLLKLDGLDWKGLTLAESLLKSARNVTPPAPPYPPVYTADSDGALLLYDVADPLRGALLSNQVFLVISAGPKFLGSCSVPYILTALILESLNQTANVPVNVTDKLKPLLNKTFVSVPAFQSAVKNLLTDPEYREFVSAITSYAADFKLTIEGFEFDLSPYVWDRNRTIILLKFQKQSIAELVSDVSNWSRAAEFNDSPPSTQQTIQAIIQDARDRNDPDLQEFRDIVDDKNWNGILALNVKVPLTGLPAELQGLAAGIDPAQFIAHHVGISVTPVQLVGQSLAAQASSLFALIDYNDKSELQPSASGYQYRVSSLKVVMRNSAIAAFSSQVELLVNRLFGDSAQLSGQERNIITFDGVYQTQGGQDAYVFASTKRNVFNMRNSLILDQVVVSGAQFVTLGPVSTPSGTKIKAKFLLSGSIVFRALSGFDVLSFGDPTTGAGLAFSNLSVDLTFDAVIPSYKEFAFDASASSLDAPISLARPASLYSHFPLKLTGLVAGGAESRPDKQNYMPVVTPLSSNGLNDNWFGLAFNLNLGTPGALAAQVGFNAGFIAAWSPATSQLSLFIGLSLPGVKGGERAITLQGALKLSFGDISFVASGASYILQLRNIALSIFGISLPPSGQTNIVLFGDPAGKDHDTIGWYAAYTKSGGTPPKTRQLPGLEDAALTSLGRARAQVNRISAERLLRASEPDPPDLPA